MRREGWQATASYEQGHWWFRARRDLFLRQVARAVAEAAPAGRRARILDYGCGTGFNLDALSRYGEACGADVPSAASEDLRRIGPHGWIDLGCDAAAHHGGFDVLTALDVLEHLDDDVAGLREMGAFLRAEGQLVLTVPAYRFLWGGEDVISEHRRRYTRGALLRACRAAGLAPLFVSYFNLSILPLAAAAVWLDRLTGGSDPPRSNLRWAPRWIEQGLYGIASLEARWVGGERLRLPAGASLVARCALRSSS